MNGTLYGTTAYGGLYGGLYGGFGTAFSVTTSGAEHVLHSFADQPDGASLTAAESVLYSFGAGTDGTSPLGKLNFVNGTLFGTTSAGGANGRVFGGYGTVFGLSPSGNETVLYNFTGGSDGAAPFAGMYSINGTLYGAANSGGKTNAGTVFAVAPIPVR